MKNNWTNAMPHEVIIAIPPDLQYLTSSTRPFVLGFCVLRASLPCDCNHENNNTEALDDVDAIENDDKQVIEGRMGKQVRQPTTRYAGSWRQRDDAK
jgi:hypothetical protein